MVATSHRPGMEKIRNCLAVSALENRGGQSSTVFGMSEIRVFIPPPQITEVTETGCRRNTVAEIDFQGPKEKALSILNFVPTCHGTQCHPRQAHGTVLQPNQVV